MHYLSSDNSQNKQASESMISDEFPIADYIHNYKMLKVEAYTHTHYNVLFLKLTQKSMTSLKKHSKDIEAHWLAFKIDLRYPE